ncbi:MAG: glucose-1-phosphate adenylyltransferase [Chloroflexi bacterium]|nr:glucose-1-phosphate adenylyltransferase [Chloroflexota bacterium]
MLRTLALILAGGDSPALSVLTAERTEAAVPFAGKFRIIDFPLSNCVNSGIYNVGVLTQYKPRSLHAHLGVGRPWDLDRAQGGLRVLHPSPTPDGGGWQRGTADAVRYNLDLIEEQPTDAVLLLAGDHIYKMDYTPLLQHHAERAADMTVAVRSVSPHDTHRFGIVSVAGDGRVDRFEEKPRRATSNLASMGIYVFRKQFLIDILAGTEQDFGRHLLPRIVANARTYAFNFQGYWADVGTVQAYYEANLALLVETPALDLYDPEWVIHTTSADLPGVEIGEHARVENCLLSDGCRVYGNVTHSVLSPGVYVSPGASVRDSIILGDAWIGPDAVVDHCIIDEGVRVGAGAVVGEGDISVPNQATPERLNTGLTLVGTHAQLPEGLSVGRNVAIRPRTPESAFPKSRNVPSGASV